MTEERPLLTVTLVVAGAPRSGKSSFLQVLQERMIPRSNRANPEPGTAALLDWLPVDLGPVGHHRVMLHLYVVPTPTGADPTRRLILADADGAIFLVDSQAQRIDDNLAALTDLWAGLSDLNGQRRQIPLVLFHTKQDLPAELILTRTELDDLLNLSGAPSFAGDTLRGTAVLEALQAVLGPALRQLTRDPFAAGA